MNKSSIFVLILSPVKKPIIYAKIIELYLSKVICLKYNNHLNQPHIIFHQQSIKYHKLSKIQKQLHQENNILY